MIKKILCLFIFLNVYVYSVNAEETIRITNGEWGPLLSEYSYEYGVASHIVTEAFKAVGVKVEWGFFPWKRAFIIAKEGEWDASAVWKRSKERENDFLFSAPVVSEEGVFFHLKDFKFDWTDMDSLKKYKIGITAMYDYQDLTKAIKDKKLSVFEVSSDEKNYKLLLRNRIDIFPNNRIVGLNQLKNLLGKDADKITYHKKRVYKSTLHLMISKQWPKRDKFLKLFNEGLEKVKTSGLYDKIIEDGKTGKYSKQKTKWKK